MADIWRLDNLRFTPLSHFFRVCLIGIGYESFHSSMVPAQFFCDFSGFSTISETTRTIVHLSSSVTSYCLPIFNFVIESDLICITIYGTREKAPFLHKRHSQINYCQILFILTPKADHSKTQLL